MFSIRRSRGLRLGLALTTAVVGTLGAVRNHGTALAATSISVNATQTLATVPSTAVGLNTAVWDGHLLDSAIPGMVHSTGAALLRFPGGSTADTYHWQTSSLTPGTGGYANPANTFDAFMNTAVKPAGAGAMVTVNYGSNSAGTGGGDPSEAAAWVNYANKVHGYGVKYWEIGNEVYGNGYYGSKWEVDLHSDHSPTAYANNALQFISAMKGVDPTIKVGLVLTAPGNWPDGQGPQAWNPTVLSIACSQADFVSVHWYAQSPGAESDSGLLSSTGGIAGMMQQLRSQLSQYCGSRASQIGIFVTESNSVSYNPGKQTVSPINGLFLLQDYLSWLQAGAQNVTWWDLHNGAVTGNNNSTSLAGTASYGDYGVLSSGNSGEPAANTPLPSFIALQMLRPVLTAGASFLPVTSSDSAVGACALKEPNGQLALVLVNRNASATATVSPSIAGWGPVTSGTVTSFSLASPQAATSSLTPNGGTVTYSLAPYSAAVLLLGASGAPSPSATPGTPTSVPTSVPSTVTPTSTPAPSSSLVLESFESGLDGFWGNSLVTNAGPSSWGPTVALGANSLWAQYSVPSAYAEARLTKSTDLDLSRYSTLSVSVFAKQPTTATGVQLRFQVQGADNQWYASAYTPVPLGARTTVTWNMAGVPRAPIRQVVLCWQFTSSAMGTGNEIWFDALQAGS